MEQLLEEALNENPNLIAKYVTLGQQTAVIYYIETLVKGNYGSIRCD
ncbi:hypothetical protein [Paenibacillus alginolyticus]|nr:hypothetical protein [Paenibacillus alginolyticus]MEC0144069.1 hypothetical protein [Paenibacillus alginolyticus]